MLRPHGGDVELIDIEEETGQVTVRLDGTCAECPGAGLTLRAGVERLLREGVPQVRSVVAAPPDAVPVLAAESPENGEDSETDAERADHEESAGEDALEARREAADRDDP